MRSIRKRLLLLQLSAVLLVSGLAVAGAYYRIRDEFYEMQDYHLQQVALLLMQQGELADVRGWSPPPGGGGSRLHRPDLEREPQAHLFVASRTIRCPSPIARG